MDKLNKYNFISGGYIFDLLDREALQIINDRFPETKDQQIYTYTGFINYEKQLCNTDNIKYRLVYVNYSEIDELYEVFIDLLDGDTQIARGEFEFKKAHHNYCETKDK